MHARGPLDLRLNLNQVLLTDKDKRTIKLHEGAFKLVY